MRDKMYLSAAKNLARQIEELSTAKVSKLSTNPPGDAVGLIDLVQWVFSERGWKALEDEPSVKEVLSFTMVSID